MRGSAKRGIWILSTLAACAACVALPVHNLTAQMTSSSPAPVGRSCLDTVSIAHALPSIVYIQVASNDSVDSHIAPALDIFAQSVAVQLRLMLHSRGDTLPPGEPAITWRSMESHTPIGVTAHRKGGTTYQLLTPRPDSVAAAMLLGASRAAEDAGEGITWMSDMPVIR